MLHAQLIGCPALDAEDAERLGARLILESGLDPAAMVALAWQFGQAVVRNRERGLRTCRICGCVDAAACVGACRWVAADLCSACEPAL